MQEDFCKVFNSEEFGQILVMKDTLEDGCPAVFVKFIPEGFGLCGQDFSFDDDDEDVAWEKVDKFFDEIDLEKAEALAKDVCRMTKNMMV